MKKNWRQTLGLATGHGGAWIAGAGVLLLAALLGLILPGATMSSSVLGHESPGTVKAALLPAGLTQLAPFQVPTPPIPRAMLIPNWEVGKNAVTRLPNYEPGMGAIVLLDETGERMPPRAPTAMLTPTHRPLPLSPAAPTEAAPNSLPVAATAVTSGSE